MIYLFCLIQLSFIGQKQKDLDSLYQLYEGHSYQAFIDGSTALLKEDPKLKHNYPFLLKLANSAYQLKKFDLSENIYSIASLKDSTLSDYVEYYHSLIELGKGDTLAFYKNLNTRLRKEKYSHLDLDLLRKAVNLTNENNDRERFIRFADHYAKHRKLQASTAFKRLNLLRKELEEKDYLKEQINFLKAYANSDYSEVVIDSIYSFSEIDSIETEDLYYLIRASVKQRFLDDSLMRYYSKIEDLDEASELKLDHILTEKKNKEAISLILKTKYEKGESSLRTARMLPRLYLRRGQSQKAYEYYLEFARVYPDHPFALNAVTFVLGRNEKKNPKFYRKVMREFVKRPSKYKDYYRFRHILHYYEKRDMKTALELTKRYQNRSISIYKRDRLSFWKAKILFELNERKKAFSILEQLAKRPFHNYYGMKSFISLKENGMDSLLIALPDIRSVKLHKEAKKDNPFKRIELLRSIYGKQFFNAEFKRLNVPLNKELEYHSYINFLIQSKLYHLAFRKSIEYSYKFPKRSKLRNPYDIQNFLFPNYFEELISENAERFNTDASLVSALIRRESAFQADVVSKANAHGLMQLLPSTGKQIAKKLDMEMNSVYDLYRPEFNIEVGTKHLSDLSKRFDNRIELVLAAYNAGASRVKKWMKSYPPENAELFIEKIPFEQTRTYVKKVMFAYYAYRILDQRFDGIYYSGIKSRS